MTPIRINSRDSFFRDPFFSDCWEIMERRKKEFEQRSNLEDVSSRTKLVENKFDDDIELMSPTYSSSVLSGRSRGVRPRFYNFYPSTALLRTNMDDIDSSFWKASEDEFGRKNKLFWSGGNNGTGLGITSDKDKFQISLDVQQFSPEELSVKTVQSTIIIEGKHEEKQDSHGFISRNFERKYTLPADVKPEEVVCNFTADGILQITAPRHHPTVDRPTIGSTTTTSSQQQNTPKSLSEKIKEDIRQAREDFDKSASDMFSSSKLRNSTNRDHSRLLRMFEPHFSAFPEFDPVPFWKRETPSTSSLIEELSKQASNSKFENSSSTSNNSLLVDEFGRKRTTTELLEEINKRKKELLKSSQGSDGTTTEFQCDRNNFKVMVDVQQFSPEEISVKTFDYFVVIEAKHEAKEDPHGYITREFKRKYMLPRDVRPEDVVCNLSSDGVLVVTAPRYKPHEIESMNRGNVVPIQHQAHHVTSAGAGGTTTKIHRIEQEADSTKTADHHHQHYAPTTTTNYHSITHEVKNSNNGGTAGEHVIRIDKEPPQSTTTTTTTTTTSIPRKPTTNGSSSHEHYIPINRECSVQSNAPGVKIEFPESRPESAASTTIGNSTSVPFDFGTVHEGSEPPVGTAELPQDPPTPTNPQPPSASDSTANGSGERIIKISLMNQ